MGRKPKNVPYIGEVKITAMSEERYNQFLHAVKMIIMESVKRRLEEERKQKNLSDGNNETQGD